MVVLNHYGCNIFLAAITSWHCSDFLRTHNLSKHFILERTSAETRQVTGDSRRFFTRIVHRSKIKMHKKVVFFQGKICVVFRKGPLGFLLQDPSEEARRIKDNPSMQDKSAPLREDLVRQNALAVVRQRGGDVSDRVEVLAEYILQFGKYKGKSFRWLLENDVGYTMYLIKSLQKEEASGICMGEGHSKDSLLSFVNYALSFAEIQSLLTYEASGVGVAASSSDDDQLGGFASRAKSTWKEIWDSRADGYANFVLGCVPGTRMFKLQQYLRKRQQAASAATSAEHA
ncbi:hypothetical protein MATL_G00136790 [Megalops atlanticus]|uniref:Uncharacterized protein n=1 Tax=Megalops atlanticus TaxID=7932 RepID=A0A9D3T5K4_MEGAT|nr:hypothetical protein MATL_G00136790 [Megalops atlanticus]